MYYLFEKGNELRRFDSHSEAFKEYEKSNIIPRAVVLVNDKNKYFRPINQRYESYKIEQIDEIKKQFYDMNLRYNP